MTGTLLAALLALPAGAQIPIPTPTGHIFCMCPGGKRGHIQAPNTCEAFCGSDSQRGFHAPRHDPYEQMRRDQEAAERARRIREDTERAARAERERLEKERQFQRNKREALGQLKGVTVEPQLKGVGDSGGLKGLKGVDEPKSALKGLASETTRPEKSCRIVDSCRAALDTQRDAMEAARTGQADLYTAMGTADLSHGLDKAQEAIKDSGTVGRVSVYVWKSKDKLGLPRYQRDYKETVDEALELVDQETLDAATKGTAGKALELKKKAETLTAFAEYMRTMLACGKGADADFGRCSEDALKNYGQTLDGLPISSETAARVKAAASAFSRYSTAALSRATDAASAASKCMQGCR